VLLACLLLLLMFAGIIKISLSTLRYSFFPIFPFKAERTKRKRSSQQRSEKKKNETNDEPVRRQKHNVFELPNETCPITSKTFGFGWKSLAFHLTNGCPKRRSASLMAR